MNKTLIIILSLVVIVGSVAGYLYYQDYKEEQRLIAEKKWEEYEKKEEAERLAKQKEREEEERKLKERIENMNSIEYFAYLSDKFPKIDSIAHSRYYVSFDETNSNHRKIAKEALDQLKDIGEYWEVWPGGHLYRFRIFHLTGKDTRSNEAGRKYFQKSKKIFIETISKNENVKYLIPIQDISYNHPRASMHSMGRFYVEFDSQKSREDFWKKNESFKDFKEVLRKEADGFGMGHVSVVEPITKDRSDILEYIKRWDKEVEENDKLKKVVLNRMNEATLIAIYTRGQNSKK